MGSIVEHISFCLTSNLLVNQLLFMFDSRCRQEKNHFGAQKNKNNQSQFIWFNYEQ